MLYTVHKVSIKKKYKSSICSTSYFVNGLFKAITILTPFILSYGSQDIWLKEVHCREQPKVNFKNQILLHIDTNVNNWKWSTNSFYNKALSANRIVPLIKYVEEDFNYDGINDFITLQLEVYLKPKEIIHSLKLLLVFQYHLQCMTEVAMEGLSIIEYDSIIDRTSTLHFNGDLTIMQRSLISSTKKNNDYNRSILPHSSRNFEDWKIENILRNYWNRNVTTYLTNIYRTMSPTNEEKVNMNIRIAYSSQKILYHPSLWHILKMAWIQYLSIFIVFIYIFDKVRTWIFTNQLCRTFVFDPITKSL